MVISIIMLIYQRVVPLLQLGIHGQSASVKIQAPQVDSIGITGFQGKVLREVVVLPKKMSFLRVFNSCTWSKSMWRVTLISYLREWNSCYMFIFWPSANGEARLGTTKLYQTFGKVSLLMGIEHDWWNVAVKKNKNYQPTKIDGSKQTTTSSVDP